MSTCEKCGAELMSKDYGNGGIVQNDSSGRMHDRERCLTARLAQREATIRRLTARLQDYLEYPSQSNVRPCPLDTLKLLAEVATTAPRSEVVK